MCTNAEVRERESKGRKSRSDERTEEETTTQHGVCKCEAKKQITRWWEAGSQSACLGGERKARLSVYFVFFKKGERQHVWVTRTITESQANQQIRSKKTTTKTTITTESRSVVRCLVGCLLLSMSTEMLGKQGGLWREERNVQRQGKKERNCACTGGPASTSSLLTITLPPHDHPRSYQ